MILISKSRKNIGLILLVTTILFLGGCKKEDPIIPNEEEVITSLKYTLTPVGGGKKIMFSFQDIDGNGGNLPIITEDTIELNKDYLGELVLLNEQNNPIEDITVEIKDEDEEHQFFYTSTLASLSIDYNDSDSDSNPIGILTKLKGTATEEGKLTIILRHNPNKSATGVSNGDISKAGGETDIEVTFNVHVK